MKLYLHIGTEKTGTTSIQQFLDQNRDALRAQGVFLPRSLGPRNHRRLPFIASDPGTVDDFAIRNGLTDDAAAQPAKDTYWAAFLTELDETADCDTTIITSEQLSSRLRSAAEISRLAGLLSPRFDTIEIIVYLRQQISYAISNYSTLIKSGGTRADILPPDRLNADYRAMLTDWQDGFGKAQLSVRLFDRAWLTGGDVVTDFCAATGLPPDRYARPDTQNESLDLMSLELLRRINRLVPRVQDKAVNPLRANLNSFLERETRGPRKTATPEQAAAYQAHFAASNEWVRARYFPDRAVLFTPFEPAAAPTQLAASDAQLDHMADLIVRIWTRKQTTINKLQPGRKPR